MTKKLCVYCASSPEIDTAYKQTAREIGCQCALHGWQLITGAGSEGLMGAVGDGCREAGGTVIGIIPQWMISQGWLSDRIDQTITVETMSDRKKLFREMSDATIVLPGGYGTMDEFFETLTLKQLGLYEKPLILLNQNHFYDHIISWAKQCRIQKFLRHNNDLDLFTTITQPHDLFNLLTPLTT